MNPEFPSQSGDIIFFSSQETKSINIFAQSLLRWKRAHHSHIAIVAKQGLAVHAMPNQGVRSDSIRSLLKGRGSGFSVYRNRTLDLSEKIIHLEYQIWHYNLQEYNYRFLLKPRKNASFCSELAAKAYEHIGMKISTRKPSKTLPLDIYSYISTNDEWQDVTANYTDFFLMDNYPESYETMSKVANFIEENNQLMNYSQRLLMIDLEKISKKHGEIPPQISFPRSYWTDPTEPSTFKVIIFIIQKLFSNLFRRK